MKSGETLGAKGKTNLSSRYCRHQLYIKNTHLAGNQWCKNTIDWVPRCCPLVPGEVARRGQTPKKFCSSWLDSSYWYPLHMCVISLLVGSPQQKIASNKSLCLISESNREYPIGDVLSRVSAFRGYLMVWMGDAAKGSSSFVRLSSLFCWFSPFVPSEVRFAANSCKACPEWCSYPSSIWLLWRAVCD